MKPSEDHVVLNEAPEVVTESLKVMKDHFGLPQAAIARKLRVLPSLLQNLLTLTQAEKSGNVINFLGASRLASDVQSSEEMLGR